MSYSNHSTLLTAAIPRAGKQISVWCRNLQDPNAPVSTQGTSIKLLHSVVEVMFARHADRSTADSYRLQLGRILDVFVSKLSFMKSQIPKLLAAGQSSSSFVSFLHMSTCVDSLVLTQCWSNCSRAEAWALFHHLCFCGHLFWCFC